MNKTLVNSDALVKTNLVIMALIDLVKQEYPGDRTLAEIVEVWANDASPDRIEALQQLFPQKLSDI